MDVVLLYEVKVVRLIIVELFLVKPLASIFNSIFNACRIYLFTRIIFNKGHVKWPSTDPLCSVSLIFTT